MTESSGDPTSTAPEAPAAMGSDVKPPPAPPLSPVGTANSKGRSGIPKPTAGSGPKPTKPSGLRRKSEKFVAKLQRGEVDTHISESQEEWKELQRRRKADEKDNERRNSVASLELARAHEQKAIELRKAQRAKTERERRVSNLNRKQMNNHQKELDDQWTDEQLAVAQLNRIMDKEHFDSIAKAKKEAKALDRKHAMLFAKQKRQHRASTEQAEREDMKARNANWHALKRLEADLRKRAASGEENNITAETSNDPDAIALAEKIYEKTKLRDERAHWYEAQKQARLEEARADKERRKQEAEAAARIRKAEDDERKARVKQRIADQRRAVAEKRRHKAEHLRREKEVQQEAIAKRKHARNFVSSASFADEKSKAAVF